MERFRLQMSSRLSSPGSLPFSDYLASLAAAIADGQSVNWADAEARAEDDEQRQRVRQLKALAAVTDVHRTWNDSSTIEADDSSTLPFLPIRLETPRLFVTRGDRFVIERLLGRGGYGVVFKAYDRERQAHVALKSLDRADIGSVYDLKKEFRLLADLSHPNLVSLYELFTDRDSWFISMELVSGVDFQTYVRQGAPPVDAVAAGARPHGPACSLDRLQQALPHLVEAVCYLHSQHKVHCDIKPSNVLVSPDGHLKVLDFGLATDLIPRRVGDTTRVRGTPAYVAPEQAAGEPATGASDWYSVGVMLFEALTGERPFSGSFVQVLEAKRHQEAPALSTLRDGIPGELDALCRSLLARDPSSRPSDAEVVQWLRTIWPSSAAVLTGPSARIEQAPFVGRSAQLDVLNRAFDRSTIGHPQLVFVHGASGMGKSSLVRHFLDVLHEREADLVILEGRCYERESVPYKALDSLVDTLSRFLRKLPRAQAEALLPRDVTSLMRLFPILRRVDAVAGARQRPIATTNAQELRRRGFAAFRELLARLTDRYAVILLIDDLQWSDADSSALIADIILGDEAPPLLFLACYRSDEAASSTALGGLLAAADQAREHARREVHEVVVGELTPDEAWQLANELARRHEVAAPLESIVAESGRSPFFINELIEYSATLTRTAEPAVNEQPPVWSGDPTSDVRLDAVIRARINHLGERARRLLHVLAVSGAPLNLRIAAEAAELPLGGLEEVTALRAAHLTRTRFEPSGEKLELYHDRIREAVTAGLARAEQQQLHGRLAAVLESCEGVEPETLVTHFHGAGNDAAAAQYAVTAADRAREAMAFARAAADYRFALDFGQFAEPRRRAIEIKLGDALAASGRGYDAAQAYLVASSRESGGDVLELKRRAAEQLLQSGHIDEGFSVVRDVLNRIGLRLAASPRRALLSLLVQRARVRIHGLRFEERDAANIPADELVRVDTCWSVATGLAIVDYIRAAEFQARHLLLALRTGERYRVVRALAMELAYSSISGVRRQVQNEKLMRVTEELAARVENPEAQALVTLVKGSAAYMQGRWAPARDLFEQAEVVLRERCTGVAWELDTAHFYTMLSLFHLGEVGELSRRLPGLLKQARERDALYVETNLRTRIAYMASLAADDPDDASRTVRDGIGRWSQQGFHLQHYYVMLATTDIDLYASRGVAAWTGVEGRWRELRRSLLLQVQPVRIESLFLRARAALAAAIAPDIGAARRTQLIAAAERDAARLANEGATWGTALSDLVCSCVATLSGQPERALARLQRAETLFEETGMQLHRAVAQRCRGVLTDGPEGELLIERSDEWMRAQHIRNGARFVAMLAPGQATDRAAAPAGAATR